MLQLYMLMLIMYVLEIRIPRLKILLKIFLFDVTVYEVDTIIGNIIWKIVWLETTNENTRTQSE